MLQRAPFTLTAEGRGLALAVVMSLFIAVAGVALVTQRSGSDDTMRLRDPRQPAPAGVVENGEETPGPDDPQAPPEEDERRQQATLTAPDTAPDVAPEADDCVPQPVDETGITTDEVVIGQIVTDVAQLPQQLGPAHEGLRAFVNQVNEQGGICGRTLRLEYRNDQMNPVNHRSAYQSLAREAFAFVGSHSLLDSQDYEQSPPFEPNYQDPATGGFVPDVGGLAFSYERSQSSWHAGVVGSLSPVLVGGAQVRHFIEDAATRGTPCTSGAIVYLREPSGASEDQARLLEVAVRESWGGDLGEGNTGMYAANLMEPVTAYEVMVERMVADGMNCVFSYTDIGSSINLVRAMHNRGVWPPDECTRLGSCFQVTYIPLSAYDSKFIQDGGPGARGVSTFIPHVPLPELDHPAMQEYIDVLSRHVPDARPSTFSIFGYASGRMFADALRACGAAPTRDCVMQHLRELEDFTAGGLLGPVTPFRTTRVTFGDYGTHDWKWIFNCTVALRVEDRNGERDFYRINPAQDFSCDPINVARGDPA